MPPFHAHRLLTVLLLPALLTAGEATPDWTGYGGPGGSRLHPAGPPTSFTPQSLRWETPLPSWGHGSPVAVGPDRVALLCEPGPENLFPLLVCLDAATGAILWRHEVSTPEQERHRADLKTWSDLHYGAIQANIGKTKGRTVPEGYDAATRALSLKMGLQVDCFRQPGNQWSSSYSCIGEAYGTPVSDGERIWACTTWGTYVCHDRDGQLRWATYDPRPGLLEHPRGSLCCVNAPSMILHGNLLISSLHDRLRAFDRDSGRLRWSHTLTNMQDSIATPAVITVGGVDVLLGDGPAAFRLPGGEPLKVEGWKDTGCQILVHPREREVACFCGAGEHCGWRERGQKGKVDILPPAAFRFSLRGDTLVGTLLWDGAVVGASGDNSPWMVVHQDRFYHRDGGILDALTGRLVAGSFTRHQGMVPVTRHLLLIAGEAVYGLEDYASDKATAPRAGLHVRGLDGKPLGDLELVRREPTPEQQAVHRYCTGDPRPWFTPGRGGRFSYGNTFAFGGARIFVRSVESLICLGNP
jgi:hypothetical protein